MGSSYPLGRQHLHRFLEAFSPAGWLARSVAVVLVATFLIAGSILAESRTVSAGEAATIVNDGSSLFQGIDDHSLIATMYAGERVDVLWGPQDGLYQVRYYGIDGWTWEANLEVDGGGGGGNTATWTDSESGGSSAIVNADSLSVRTDASFDAGILGYLPGGDGVDIIGDPANGFVPIAYGGGLGWVYVDYLDWDGSVSYSSAGVGGMTSAVPEASVSAEHWIDVNRSNGAVTLYIGDVPQATYWGSLSYDTSDGGFYTTASGTYHVYRMYEPLAYTAYAKAYITDWVGFDPERDNGFHSWTKDANGNVLPNGAGNTGGCVGLEPGSAEAVFNFSFMGMRVVIHD